MTGVAQPLDPGTPVDHPRHGKGRVVADMGSTIVVRFVGSLEQVLSDEITVVPSLDSALRAGAFDAPIDAVVRAQALAIASVNDNGASSRDPACSCCRTSCGSAAP